MSDPAKTLVVPGEGQRYTAADAEAAGHALEPMDREDGRYWGDCSCRNWFSAHYGTRDGLHRAFVEHAAEAEGVCWACSHPDDGRNTQGCYRCWVMWWSRERHVMPMQIPTPWPGVLT